MNLLAELVIRELFLTESWIPESKAVLEYFYNSL